MPKFVVTTVGTVRYTAELIVEAASEVEAEALALVVMPSISKETCDGEDDIDDVEVNETSPLEEGEELPRMHHTIHHSATVAPLIGSALGDETFFVISWNLQEEFRVCSAVGPSRVHPDGYFWEKGKFRDLVDARAAFERLVQAAQKKAARPVK